MLSTKKIMNGMSARKEVLNYKVVAYQIGQRRPAFWLQCVILRDRDATSCSNDDAFWAWCIEGSPQFGHKWKLLAVLGGIFMKNVYLDEKK